MKKDINILGVAFLALPILAAIVIYSCVLEDAVRDVVEIEEVMKKDSTVTKRPADTTGKDTSRHEITFAPYLEVWTIDEGGDTTRL